MVSNKLRRWLASRISLWRRSKLLVAGIQEECCVLFGIFDLALSAWFYIQCYHFVHTKYKTACTYLVKIRYTTLSRGLVFFVQLRVPALYLTAENSCEMYQPASYPGLMFYMIRHQTTPSFQDPCTSIAGFAECINPPSQF